LTVYETTKIDESRRFSSANPPKADKIWRCLRALARFYKFIRVARHANCYSFRKQKKREGLI